MKNDLDRFEKNLLAELNRLNGTNFTHLNFVEWSSSKPLAERNLMPNEILYEVRGMFVAIRPNETAK